MQLSRAVFVAFQTVSVTNETIAPPHRRVPVTKTRQQTVKSQPERRYLVKKRKPSLLSQFAAPSTRLLFPAEVHASAETYS